MLQKRVPNEHDPQCFGLNGVALELCLRQTEMVSTEYREHILEKYNLYVMVRIEDYLQKVG